MRFYKIPVLIPRIPGKTGKEKTLIPSKLVTQTLALLANTQLKANSTNKQDKTKSPTDAFGETNVHKLLLLCHAEPPRDLL